VWFDNQKDDNLLEHHVGMKTLLNQAMDMGYTDSIPDARLKLINQIKQHDMITALREYKYNPYLVVNVSSDLTHDQLTNMQNKFNRIALR
jgi:hypothetical protein